MQKKRARVDNDRNAEVDAGSKNLLFGVPESDGLVKAICYPNKHKGKIVEVIFGIICLKFVHC